MPRQGREEVRAHQGEPEAAGLGVEGRSKMTKQQLQRAVAGHKGGRRS